MGLYDSFVDNIKGGIVDNAVDNTLDKVKSSFKASTIYVWTAISRETIDYKTINIIFMNTLGQKRRVAVVELDDFCKNNYVSNLVMENGNMKFLGITIYDLPDYKLGRDGQWSVSGKYNEDCIYNMATSYIQLQQTKICQDKKNHCLRGTSNEETHSNFTQNVSNIKDISQAAAVTAVTTAVTATVAGIGFVGKAIYRKLNAKQVAELQTNICNKLDNYSEMIDILTRTKYATNNELKADSSIVDYNNDFEARHNNRTKLVNEIRQYGIVGCVKNIESRVENLRSQAETNKVLDYSLKGVNTTYGTLQAYIGSLTGRIATLKQLHTETGNLLKQHRQQMQMIEQQRQAAEQNRRYQDNLLNIIDNSMQDLDTKLSQVEASTIDQDSVVFIQQTVQSLSLSNLISNIDNQVNQLQDENIRYAYRGSLQSYNQRIGNINNNITRILETKKQNCRNEISQSLDIVDTKVAELISGRYYGTEYTDTMSEVEQRLAKSLADIELLNEVDKNVLKARIENLATKLDNNRAAIEKGVNKATQDKNAFDEVESTLANFRIQINENSDSREIKDALYTLNGSTLRKANNITNQDLRSQALQKLNDIVTEFTNRIDQIERDKQQKAEELNILGNQLLDEIRQEITKVDNQIKEVYKQSDLDNFKVDVDAFSDRLRAENFEYKIKNEINQALSTLRSHYRTKRWDMESFLSKYTRAVNDINRTLAMNKSKIENSSARTWELQSVIEKLNNLKFNSDYSLLRDKETADREIQQLIDQANTKLSSLSNS